MPSFAQRQIYLLHNPNTILNDMKEVKLLNSLTWRVARNLQWGYFGSLKAEPQPEEALGGEAMFCSKS